MTSPKPRVSDLMAAGDIAQPPSQMDSPRASSRCMVPPCCLRCGWIERTPVSGCGRACVQPLHVLQQTLRDEPDEIEAEPGILIVQLEYHLVGHVVELA